MIKYQVSIIALIIALISSVVTCNSRPTQDDQYKAEMISKVQQCEAVLDTLATKISFDDTVAEGDDYQLMLESKQHFEETNDIEAMEAYYDQYHTFFIRVYWQCLDQLNNNAVERYKDSLPIHTCGKGE